MTPDPIVPPVLIIGAGPVGLVLAVDLARRRVPIRVLDALPTATTESRAVVVHARSLEMMDALGVARPLLETGRRSTAAVLHAEGETLARIPLDEIDSRYPFSLTTPQTETERILTERLTALGVAIERGATLVDLAQDDGGVTATVKRGDGAPETIRARFAVGTDGARSAVRKLVGERLDGDFKGEWFLMGDVEVTHAHERSSLHLFLSPRSGPGMVFPMQGDRARIIVEITDAADRGREATIPWLQEVANARGLGVTITSAHWLTTFEIHHAQVARYRVGRVFLAGDAAHVHSPAGGQGMNTGMQDAFNLGWKLALAYAGGGDDALLDSYHAERHPIAAKVISVTTTLTRVATVDSRFQREVRNRLMQLGTKIPFVRHTIANELEELAIGYRDSPIVVPGGPGEVKGGDAAPDVAEVGLWSMLCRYGAGADGGHTVLFVAADDGMVPPLTVPRGARAVVVLSAATGAPDVLADPGRKVAARYGFGARGGVVVIRPDGYVAAVCDAKDTTPAQRYLAKLAAPGAPVTT